MLGKLVNHIEKKIQFLSHTEDLNLAEKKSICKKQNFKVLAVNVGEIVSWSMEGFF